MKQNLVVIASLVGLLAVAGCKKDKKDEGAVTPPAGSAAATPSGSAGGPAVNAGGVNLQAGSGGPSMTAGSGGPSMANGSGGPSMAAGSGAAGATAGANMSDAELEGMIKEMVKMMSDVSGAAKGKDCAAAAAGIKAAIASHAPFIEKMKTLGKDKSLEQRAEKIMESGGYEKQLEAAMGGMGEVTEKCENDPAFGEAMKAMGEALE
jgi:hypothetical protein